MLHKVFVYGSLKKGFINSHWLTPIEDRGEHLTLESFWDMHSFGRFPAVIRGHHRIKGEVYCIDDDGLSELDILESNGHLYTREVVLTTDGPAYMYIFNHDVQPLDRDNIIEEKGVLEWQQ